MKAAFALFLEDLSMWQPLVLGGTRQRKRPWPPGGMGRGNEELVCPTLLTRSMSAAPMAANGPFPQRSSGGVFHGKLPSRFPPLRIWDAESHLSVSFSHSTFRTSVADAAQKSPLRDVVVCLSVTRELLLRR